MTDKAKIADIHNTLMTIHVSGEDVMKLAKCIMVLREIATTSVKEGTNE